MATLNQGSLRLFRFAGIDVFLHWSWFLVAAYMVSQRSHLYSAIQWNVLEYLALFGIVLLHEFGHALACRQVGGRSDRIMLWPLGGVAYVNPPQRPGATLWSIAAGPLVNVILAPALLALSLLMRSLELADAWPNAHTLLRTVTILNFVLLIFNLLPIYPLDGGQILRSLLWFLLGRAHSLLVASIIGFLGVGVMILAAVFLQSIWFGILAGFVLLNCWQGLRQALALARVDKMPHRTGFACPTCGAAPLIGAYWRCGQCRTQFDTFETGTVCPHCGAGFDMTRCPDCGAQHPMNTWRTRPPIPGNYHPIS
ncbi:MAG: site-2 protease family protein [Verrucomicrobia bacterium]|nr:site-2 protease family protein [Verrucomicrobiota bacterium]MBU4247397.1 site-2 protease family protein [Verrucomicrobiota bacterium]MBU4292125.1 site-2 protease family protein [Verrucomicrobiota bacterium]MBU4498202.1 site-2 protease family protein [Verrucomicrobiota bacterium]MCG2681402.1 site-2 protease family protein [Kiritimatiellia bacterium]